MGPCNCFTTERIIISNSPSEPIIDEEHDKKKPKQRKPTNKGIRRINTFQKQIKRSGTGKTDDLKATEFSESLVCEFKDAKTNARKTLNGTSEAPKYKRSKTSKFAPKTHKDSLRFMPPLMQEFVVRT
ncbi:unnamed protein product [Moneuplotes crassus]|uniref:Uncharacterized protein n=1 Tax=Euplotes crassus TaxID=5936 RepID=A0AAD2D6E3_EUPCR|nr:unnamed protein product [Moneuplotes crassus]